MGWRLTLLDGMAFNAGGTDPCIVWRTGRSALLFLQASFTLAYVLLLSNDVIVRLCWMYYYA